MVLDSQRARPETGRGGMSSGGRRSAMKWPLTIGVIAVVAGAGWYMIRASGGTGEATGSKEQVKGVTAQARDFAPLAAGLGGSSFSTPPAPPAPPASPTPQTPPAPDAGTVAQAQGETAPPAPAPASPPPTDGMDATAPKVTEIIRQGHAMIQQNNPVAGRKLLNQALAGQISKRDAEVVRQEIAAVNQTLVFSPQVVAGDPYAEVHVVKSGELLATIAPQYKVPWRFLATINNISDPKLLRVDARLKTIKGPFHVVVHKESFRADVYLDPADGSTAGGDMMFVRSFPVALGAYDSTPLGTFVVRKQSKLVNPEWVNPRTGQRYLASDPLNPIGEYWIGLDGTDDNTRNLRGYGLHGTIDPASIGRQASMGCVRFLPADIELLFSMLNETDSRVTIREQ